MKGLFVSGIVLALTFTLQPGVCWAEDFNIAHWSHMADINANKFIDKGVVELTLTPEIYNRARRDLRDLRVVANRSEDMGFIHRTPRPHSYKVPQKGRLYNRSYVPNKSSSLTVDFNRKQMKNSLDILTEGANFRRKVLIQGSDDENNWTVIRDNAYLFRISGKNKGKAAYVIVVNDGGLDLPESLEERIYMGIYESDTGDPIVEAEPYDTLKAIWIH